MSLCDLSRDGSALVLRLNRPESRNALSLALLDAMMASIDAIAADPEARVAVITGVDAASFCAGADLKERRTMTEDQVRQTVAQIRRVVEAVAALPIPVVAAIRGVALGGGLELALACDVRFAAEDALLGLVETRLAIIPGAGGTQRLSRLIGAARAKELIFSGRRLSGSEALEWGVVEHVEASDGVIPAAMDLAREIGEGGPVAVRQAKLAINRGIERSLEEGLAIEREAYEAVIGTRDREEGLRAFAEKRKPMYEGR